MYSGYRTIFWGIFFVSFYINITGIRIVPAFIAWIIVARGIDKLLEFYHSTYFEKAKLYSIIVATLTFISGLMVYTQTATYSIISTVIWPVTSGVLELLTEYHILSGSIECLKITNKIEIAEDYTKKTSMYSIAFIIFIILECITISLVIENLIVLVAIFGLILRIIFMGMMSNLKIVQEDEPVCDEDIKIEK